MYPTQLYLFLLTTYWEKIQLLLNIKVLHMNCLIQEKKLNEIRLDLKIKHFNYILTESTQFEISDMG